MNYKKYYKNAFILIVIAFVFISSCNVNSLNDTWIKEGNDNDIYILSGKNFEFTYFDTSFTLLHDGEIITTKGTYSITGDNIEFIDSNGGIFVLPFSHTDNIIKIGEERYIRKR